jgi:hypothetical protein
MPGPNGGEKSKEGKGASDNRLIVTRAIMDETRQHLGLDPRLSDQQVLEWMRRTSGREIVLVETVPDDEEVIVICSPVAVVPGSLMAQCAECGTTIFHSRNAPVNAKKICTRCGPRLGH